MKDEITYKYLREGDHVYFEGAPVRVIAASGTYPIKGDITKIVSKDHLHQEALERLMLLQARAIKAGWSAKELLRRILKIVTEPELL